MITSIYPYIPSYSHGKVIHHIKYIHLSASIFLENILN